MRRGIHSQIPDDETDSHADRAVTALYGTHYRSLVRLAALLVPDAARAEQIVQDSFVVMYSAWNRLESGDHARDFLIRSVVQRSRRVPRHRAARAIAETQTDASPAGQAEDTGHRDSALAAALRSLPALYREVLVLRYYADLPDAQIASAMNITTAAVGRLTARAMASLNADLPWADD